MDTQQLIAALLALPDREQQRQFIATHPHSFDQDVAPQLKAAADRFLHADTSRSLAIAELIIELADSSGDPDTRAIGVLAEANVRSIGLAQYAQAIELYDQAAAIYASQNRIVEQAKSQVGKIWALATLGRPEEALAIGAWASTVFEEHAAWLLLAKLTSNLAAIHGRAGEDIKALTMLDRAQGLYAQLGPQGQPYLARIAQNRAIVLRNLGDFTASIAASKKAWSITAELGQKAESGRAQQNLAFTYFVLGRYNEALKLLDQAREVFLKDARHFDAAVVDLYISDCLLQLRRFPEALKQSLDVRTTFSRLGTHQEAAQATLNSATAYAGLQRHAEALAALDDARALFAAEAFELGGALADLQKATIFYRQTQFEACFDTALQAAQIFQAHDRTLERAQAQLIAARAASAQARPQIARQLVSEALQVSQEKDIPLLAYQAQHLLGTLNEGQNDLQAAQEAYAQAIQEVERLRGQLMVEFRVNFFEDKQDIYEDAVRLSLTLDQAAQGLDYAERAKSRALLDLLAYRLDIGLRARTAQDRAKVDALLALRTQRDRLYRRWASQDEFKVRGWKALNSERQQIQHEVLVLERKITALWHKLLVHNADYARDASLWYVHTEPVQPHLQPDTTLVEYFTVRGRMVAFVVTRSGVTAHYLPGDLRQTQRLSQLLHLNLRAVTRQPVGQAAGLLKNAQGLLQQLYQMLLAPLQPALDKAEKLIIVPHGPLHYLPLHALHDGSRYLIEDHEISYLPGASLLRYCDAVAPSAGPRVTFGHSGAGRLPYASAEARLISGILDGPVYLEESATLARLRATAPDCNILHLAAHGEFRQDNPLFSGLALADGWLTTFDVFNLRLKAALVTLSACQTGRSVVGGGDELLGLMRAFLYAGAASLLLSLWPLEDRSTAHLMEIFYRQLTQPQRKGAALRYVQLRFIQGQGHQDTTLAQAYQHPYFWAPFFLVGNTGHV